MKQLVASMQPGDAMSKLKQLVGGSVKHTAAEEKEKEKGDQQQNLSTSSSPGNKHNIHRSCDSHVTNYLFFLQILLV